jgi:hypothetical protein
LKLRTLFTTLAIAAAASLTSAPVLAQMVPCNSYTCMAGMSGAGATGGPGCEPATQAFFSIVIYDEEGIDFPATALARQTYLMTCPGATTGTNLGILEAIIAEWGMVVY